MKWLFLFVLFVLFLTFVNAVSNPHCGLGEICTVKAYLQQVDSADIENLKKFDFIITNKSGLKFGGPNSMVDVIDESVPVVMHYGFTQALQYVDPNDPLNLWTEINQNNDWFMLDTQGNRIYNLAYSNLFEIDVRNIEYQDFISSKTLLFLNHSTMNGKLDGFFHDNSASYQAWVDFHMGGGSCSLNNPSTCPTSSVSQSEWEGSVIDIFGKVDSIIGSNRWVTINGHYEGYTSSVDAQTYEGWVHAGWQAADYFSNKNFTLGQIDWLANSLHAGRSVFVLSGVSGGGDLVAGKKVRLYTFAAYLIGKRNDAFNYYTFDERGSGTRVDYYPELYDDLDLGLALGNRYTVSGVYVRDYANGKVLLNLDDFASPSIDLGGQFQTLDGDIISSVSLQDHEGLILLTPGSVNCDVDSDGFDSLNCGGLDCDDSNPNVNPNGIEICGDGIDQDCSGQDLMCQQNCDIDLDGIDSISCGGLDCDDNNPNINPGQSEICGDGIDQDCNGSDAVCILTCGNGQIDSGEDCSNCAQDVSCSFGEICCSGVCSLTNCSNDSQCNDNDSLTIDECINSNACNSFCSNILIDDNGNGNGGGNPNLCGNNRIDSGENCSSCALDVRCVVGRVCCSGSCRLPACSSDLECDDNDPCTIDSCSSACGAGCSHSRNPACDVSLNVLNIELPVEAVNGELFIVTILNGEGDPVIGANVIYGSSASFTDLFGRVEFEADIGVSLISVSKVGFPSASSLLSVIEPKPLQLAELFDLTALDDLMTNPILLFAGFGVILGVAFFYILLMNFRNDAEEE